MANKILIILIFTGIFLVSFASIIPNSMIYSLNNFQSFNFRDYYYYYSFPINLDNDIFLIHYFEKGSDIDQPKEILYDFKNLNNIKIIQLRPTQLYRTRIFRSAVKINNFYYITGAEYSMDFHNFSKSQIFVSKISSDGNLLNEIRIHYQGIDSGSYITNSENNILLFTNDIINHKYNMNIIVMNQDLKVIKKTVYKNYYILSFRKDHEGNIICVGIDSFKRVSVLLKFSKTGKLIFKKQYIGGAFKSVIIDKDNRYIVLEDCNRNDQFGIITFSKNGDVLRNKKFKKPADADTSLRIVEFNKEFIVFIASSKPRKEDYYYDNLYVYTVQNYFSKAECKSIPLFNNDLKFRLFYARVKNDYFLLYGASFFKNNLNSYKFSVFVVTKKFKIQSPLSYYIKDIIKNLELPSPPSTPVFVWKQMTRSFLVSNIVVEGCNVLFTSGGMLSSLDKENGAYTGFYYLNSKYASAPVLDEYNKHIYVGSGDGNLYCFDNHGNFLYKFNAGYSITTKPVVNSANKEVYFVTDKGYVYSINSEGALINGFDLKKDVSAPLEIYNGVVYVVTTNGVVYALKEDLGRILWSFKLPEYGQLVAQPKVFDNIYADTGTDVGADTGTDTDKKDMNSSFSDRLLLGSTNGYLYSIDCNTGKLLGKFKTKGKITSKVVVYKEKIYLTSQDGNLYCLDKDLKLLWKYHSLDSISNPVSIDKYGNIYLPSNKVYILNQDGKVIYSYLTNDSIDTSIYLDKESDNMYFVSNGYVYCVRR